MLTLRPYRGEAVQPAYAPDVIASLEQTVKAVMAIAASVKPQPGKNTFSVENPELGMRESWAEAVDIGSDSAGLVRVMLRFDIESEWLDFTILLTSSPPSYLSQPIKPVSGCQLLDFSHAHFHSDGQESEGEDD